VIAEVVAHAVSTKSCIGSIALVVNGRTILEIQWRRYQPSLPDLMQANGFSARRRRCPVYRTADQRRPRKPRQLARGINQHSRCNHQINGQTEDIDPVQRRAVAINQIAAWSPRSLVTVEMLVWLYAFIIGRIAEIAARRTDIACFLGIRT
jgi:hypothetical protein